MLYGGMGDSQQDIQELFTFNRIQADFGPIDSDST